MRASSAAARLARSHVHELLVSYSALQAAAPGDGRTPSETQMLAPKSRIPVPAAAPTCNHTRSEGQERDSVSRSAFELRVLVDQYEWMPGSNALQVTEPRSCDSARLRSRGAIVLKM